jgi:myo-inositol-1(or 4)-monophosphatase
MALAATYVDQAQTALEAVARSFRPRLLEAWGKIELQLKTDNTPVTILDLEIETVIKDTLRAINPAIGFEGEEHGKEGNEKTFWLIDPIDGTEQFVRGLTGFRIMATLINNDEPQFAFVYEVPVDELYTARKDGGAFCNGKALQVSDRPLHRAILELTANMTQGEVARLMPAITKRTRGVRITRDFTHTLQGRLEGHLYYKANGSSWDWVPWALLIREAGGKVANLGKRDYRYRNGDFLAANPIIFDDLMTDLDTALTGEVKK